MCLEREFHTLRSDKDGAHFRPGEMSYDVKCLEIMAELVVPADRHSEQQAVVLPAVQGCRDWVYVHFLAQVEHLSGEWYLVDIYLDSETAVARESLYCIGKPARDKVSM